MKRKVLITGGMGFIGSFLVDELVKRGYTVTVFDNLDPQVHPESRPPSYANSKAVFIKGDVRDYEHLKAILLQGHDAVFHYAAAVGIGQSNWRIKHYCDVNQGGTANLLDILANNRTGVGKLILAASMSSYGEGLYTCPIHGSVRPPVRVEAQMARGDWDLDCPTCGAKVQPVPTPEDAALHCASVYAINKMNQEQLVLTVARTYDIPCVSLRYFNVYGPRQSLSNPYTGVSAIFLSRLKNGKAPILYEDGRQTRDFVSVHDVVAANLLALESAAADFLVFNIGSGISRTIESIARDLSGLLGRAIEPEISGKFRKGDVRHCYADLTRARRVLSFEPRVDFLDGMRELVEWSRTTDAFDRFDTAERELSSRGIVRA